MRSPPRTLRRTITIAVVTLALLAGVAAGALVALTTVLHNASVRSTVAVESVRLAEEVQRDILVHDRVRNPSLRAHIAAGLRDRLDEARMRVQSPAQRDALAVSDRAVSDYLTAADAPVPATDDVAAKHAAAFDALERLVALNLDDARRAYANVTRYEGLAHAIGIAVASAVALASAVIVWWFHARALHSLFGLERAMKRFGHGAIDERASDEGPAELAGMARCFNEMATSISRQRRERQTFIAGVAHDLRTPLSVLRMASDVVKSSPERALDPARSAKLFDTVRRQVERLERMIGDLLDSASVEAGHLTLKIATADLRELALDVTEHFAATSPAHELVVEVPDAPLPIDCDAMRIEQVLSNLVSNAIKYSPNGGRVSVVLKAADDDVTVTVTDQGIGMTDEDAAKAFEPFRRSAALRDQVAGSGLGLFVVRRLVEAHGGRVDERTKPGEGSTFEVCLPRAAAPLTARSSTAARSSPRNGRLAPALTSPSTSRRTT
jgi:signal transduction histidine kinase